jgi:hypothetical protein
LNGIRHFFYFKTNFYSGGGSKLNETARSYAQLADNISKLPQVLFVWIIDGKGWISTKEIYLKLMVISSIFILFPKHYQFRLSNSKKQL